MLRVLLDLMFLFSTGFFSEINETNESLKTKMSELRLYCDLLMQQVHTIQEYVHHDENQSSPSTEVPKLFL